MLPPPPRPHRPGRRRRAPARQRGRTQRRLHRRSPIRCRSPRPASRASPSTVDWGTRCDTSTGRLAVPDFFAQPCYAPFTGDNGGATAPGVTGDEITIVYYEGQESDPIIAYITDAVHVDDTNADQFATMKELIRYYETYYEMYGRKVNLITFEGTGIATDEVAARADAAQIALQYQAVRGVRRSGADQRVRRRVGRPQGDVLRLHAGPAGVVLQRPRSVRLGSRRQPGTERSPHRRVPDQADHRQERQPRRRCGEGPAAQARAAVPGEQQRCQGSGRQVRRRHGGRRLTVRRGRRLRPRPGNDPGDRHPGHHQDEDSRSHDHRVQR